MSVWGLVGFATGVLLVRVVRHFERKRIRQEEIRQRANLSEKPAQNSPKCGADYRQQLDESSTICRKNYTTFGTR